MTESHPPESLSEIDSERASNALDRGIVWLGQKLSLVFALVAVVSCYEIARRYLFDDPTIWVHETATFLGGALFILGGLYALATDRHVRVVLVYDAVSDKARTALRIVHHLFGLAFSGMMLFASWTMARKAVLAPWGDIRFETSGSAWNPPFPAYIKVLILVAFVVMTVQFILHLVRDIRLLRKA
ncbi:TRAP transporter small permease subunit [Saccharospirillum salsuginis]|uniref:TRAP transporter small permease protein n=1 Tax=Saccharospirillum salsuginis TaxID=418750 RepID=A0A918N7C4_9GAMM|nr:TRAP transporter small permease subunit [Saccharospirillum salsuginis]GGX47242.1 hypothetical protein GCM10007392_12590 [Saccharospirillum salsuginis]